MLKSRTTEEIQAEIEQIIFTQTGMKVFAGPYRGMTLLRERSWATGDIPAKLIGSYEIEVQEALVELARLPHDAVVDIGCAEGFHAIGAAMITDRIPVYAYDTNPEAVRIVKLAAEANGVAERVEGRGLCDAAELARLAAQHPRLLLISDCEGYEKTLFTDPVAIAAVATSDLVIECHDFLDPTVTANIMLNLRQSHRIDIVYSGARDPNAVPFLRKIPDLWRWLVVQERRPCVMHWLICTALRRMP